MPYCGYGVGVTTWSALVQLGLQCMERSCRPVAGTKFKITLMKINIWMHVFCGVCLDGAYFH